MPHRTGVVFPITDPVSGRRSTSSTGRAIVSDALRAVDPVGAASASRETNWRQGYLPHFRRLVEAGLGQPEGAVASAEAGLRSLHERMRWVPAGAVDADEYVDESLHTVLDAAHLPPDPSVGSGAGWGPEFDTETVTGAAEPDAELSIPLGGRRLRGDELRRTLDDWVARGIVEQSCRSAVLAVMDNPDWLRCPDRTIVVLGATAEMGPMRSLLRWGAHVAAVDLPRTEVWHTLLDEVRAGAGQVSFPVVPGTGQASERAGADVISDAGRLTRWVLGLPGRLTIGNYVYVDGETHVRAAAAVDLLVAAVARERGAANVGLALLATPTDVFAVPEHVVRESVDRYESSRASRVLRAPLRAVSGGRLLRRNYAPGVYPGINDSVVVQQGPNYLLAKRIQRWRATVHRSVGGPTSLRIAPPTRTQSVVKNRALAAAYAGAHRFGIEVFEPGTANTLMAALLVHDLNAGTTPHQQAWQDEADGAAHGGLWTCAYEPRSALGLAALLGVASAR